MKKSFLVLGLIIFVIFNTTHIYAYWKDTNQNMYITDEKPVEIISQSLGSDEGKQLVPKGVVLGEHDVYEIKFTYIIFVQLDKELEVDIQNLTVNDSILPEHFKDLFIFTIEKQILSKDTLTIHLYKKSEEGYFFEVNLFLSMNMPTREQYEIIAGGLMKFEVTFNAI